MSRIARNIGLDGRMFLAEAEWLTYLRRMPVRYIRSPKRKRCQVCGMPGNDGNPLQNAYRNGAAASVAAVAAGMQSESQQVMADDRLSSSSPTVCESKQITHNSVQSSHVTATLGNGQRRGIPNQANGSRSLFDSPGNGSIQNRFGDTSDAGKRPSWFREKERQQTLFDSVPEDANARVLEMRRNGHNPPAATAKELPHEQRAALPRVEAKSLPHTPCTETAIASGEKAKARDILAAVSVLKTIERNGRPATAEEHETLARFEGFGPVALGIFPDPVTSRYKDDGWRELGEKLEKLLTTEEYESAKRTTFNAFYTSPTVIAAIHETIDRLGVPNNALVLEPGCGIGNFLRRAPPQMRFIGVELDLISGRIAKELNPDHDIRIENFRDTKIPEGSLDAVVGNVPFADVRLDYRGQKLALHDFFIAKSIDLLRPGGVLAVVTSRFTLDKQNAAIREYLAAKADFAGAVRLPSDAFKREGTAVVTDILFLRRRADGEASRHADPEWLEVGPLSIDGKEASVNRYFLNHPDMVLGTWSTKDTLYGEGVSVLGNGDLSGDLRDATGRLPTFAPLNAASDIEQAQPFIPPTLEPHIDEGSFFLSDDGSIRQLQEGQPVPVHYAGKELTCNDATIGRRLASLIRLRDLARRVLQSQNEGWPEHARDSARRELNSAYDRFVARFGPINKTTFGKTQQGHVIRRAPNLVKFCEDPDAMLVMSLEDYDEESGKATKTAIMSKDVVGRIPPVTTVNCAEEGLLVSLNQHGKVDLPFIASLYDKPEDRVAEELGDFIFSDPANESWQTADAYLSWNVRAKLAAALNAGPEYSRNVEFVTDLHLDIETMDIHGHASLIVS